MPYCFRVTPASGEIPRSRCFLGITLGEVEFYGKLNFEAQERLPIKAMQILAPEE